MNKCVLCEKEAKKKGYCELCRTVLVALNKYYNTTQIMGIFSHVIGAKITKEITETMYDTLKSQYEAGKLKEKEMLN